MEENTAYGFETWGCLNNAEKCYVCPHKIKSNFPVTEFPW